MTRRLAPPKAVTVRRNYAYRIYPTRWQHSELERQLRLCCDLYNAALEQRRRMWRDHDQSITFREQSTQLTPAVAPHTHLRGTQATTFAPCRTFCLTHGQSRTRCTSRSSMTGPHPMTLMALAGRASLHHLSAAGELARARTAKRTPVRAAVNVDRTRQASTSWKSSAITHEEMPRQVEPSAPGQINQFPLAPCGAHSDVPEELGGRFASFDSPVVERRYADQVHMDDHDQPPQGDTA